MELQAFVLGNLRLPSAAMLLLFSLGVRFRACGFREFSAYLRRLGVGHRRGKRSRMLLDVEFEKRWMQPVTLVTAELIAESCPCFTTASSNRPKRLLGVASFAWRSLPGSFGMALAVTALVVGLGLSVSGASFERKTEAQVAALQQSMVSDAPGAITSELARMEKVNANWSKARLMAGRGCCSTSCARTW